MNLLPMEWRWQERLEASMGKGEGIVLLDPQARPPLVQSVCICSSKTDSGCNSLPNAGDYHIRSRSIILSHEL